MASDGIASNTRSSGHPAFSRLKARAEFLNVGRGRRWHGKALTLQAAPRAARAPADDGDAAARFGFTLTKKVGCAVVRNRVRRRLREIVRLGTDLPARPGHDYVLIGREAGLRMPFAELRQELERGLAKVHGEARQDGRGAGARTGIKPGSKAGERTAEGRPAPERIRPRP